MKERSFLDTNILIYTDDTAVRSYISTTFPTSKPSTICLPW